MYRFTLQRLMALRNALILGILYLTFQAFPIIFEAGHGFNTQMTGMTFLGIGVGMFLAILSQPSWNRSVDCFSQEMTEPLSFRTDILRVNL